MRNLLLGLSLSLCLLQTASLRAADAAQAPLTNDQVISLLKAGLGEGLISRKIKSSPNAFDLSPEEMIRLKKNDVPDNIIELMLQQQQEQEQQARSRILLEIQKLVSPEANVRDAAFVYLQRSGSTAVSALNGMLSNTRPELRAASALALARLGQTESAPYLRTLLADNDVNVRLAAGEALGMLRDDVGRDIARKSVVAGSGPIDGSLRMLGVLQDAQSLGFIRLRLLEDGDPVVREQAARAIGKISGSDGACTQALIHALSEDQDLRVKYAAVSALSTRKEASALQALKQACENLPAVRAEALGAIGEFSQPEAVEFLVHSLRQELNDHERTLVLQALRRMTHQDYGNDPSKWLLWLETNRASLRGDTSAPKETTAPAAPAATENKPFDSVAMPEPPSLSTTPTEPAAGKQDAAPATAATPESPAENGDGAAK